MKGPDANKPIVVTKEKACFVRCFISDERQSKIVWINKINRPELVDSAPDNYYFSERLHLYII